VSAWQRRGATALTMALPPSLKSRTGDAKELRHLRLGAHLLLI